jgi:hypothetical protein
LVSKNSEWRVNKIMAALSFCSSNNVWELFEHHVNQLELIVRASGEAQEGSCVYAHRSFYRNPQLKEKQEHLINLSQSKHHILEIGFNAGHSCLLFCLANSTGQIDLFDNQEHSYAKACFEYLDQQFPNRLTMHWGNSAETLPLFCREAPKYHYDLIHLDGNKTSTIMASDLLQARYVASPDSIVIFNDVNFPQLAMLYSWAQRQKIITDVPFISLKPCPHPYALCRYSYPDTEHEFMI